MSTTDKKTTEPTLEERVTNLRDLVERQTLARDTARTSLAQLDTERAQLAAAGDLKGMEANTEAQRQARTALTDAERDLSDAQTWLSAAQEAQAAQDLARQAAAAEAAVEPAMKAFRDALEAAIERVNSAAATILRLADEIRGDFDTLASASGEARAAVALSHGYTNPGVVAPDPTSTVMDAAFLQHPGVMRVWHGARRGDVPLFDALAETARQARAESRSN